MQYIIRFQFLFIWPLTFTYKRYFIFWTLSQPPPTPYIVGGGYPDDLNRFLYHKKYLNYLTIQLECIVHRLQAC